MEENVIPIGKLSKPIGLKGRLKVNLFTKGLKTILGAKVLYLKGPEGEYRSFQVESINLKEVSAGIKLKGIESHDEASNFKDWEVCVDLDALPSAGKDEYYHHQIVGCDVFSTSGAFIGKVKGIFETGANDVWCIDGAEKEILIPAVQSIVKDVNLKTRRIEIEIIEGLLND